MWDVRPICKKKEENYQRNKKVLVCIVKHSLSVIRHRGPSHQWLRRLVVELSLFSFHPTHHPHPFGHMTFMDLALGGLRRLGTPVFTMLWVVWRAVAQVLVAALLDDDLADRSLGWVPAFVALHAAANLGYAWGQWCDTFTTSDGHVIVRTANGCHFTVPPPADDSLQGLGLGPREDASALLPTVASAPDIELAVAVVVPVLVTDAADLEQLSKLVARLLGQTLPPRHVIIVDDGSPVEVATRTKALMTSTTGSEIEVVRLQCNRGPAVARNAGVDRAVALNSDAAAAGKLVVFLTDLDCLPLEDWTERGVAAVAARRPFLVNASLHSELGSAAAQNKSQPLLVGGTTVGSNPLHAVDGYHDRFGTLNPRLLVLRDLDVAAVAVQPLYAPTCNLALYLGDGTSSRLPRFNERFREASMEDVLFCLQAWAQRHIEFAVQEVRMCRACACDACHVVCPEQVH